MDGYRPLDLTPWYNVGQEWVEGAEAFPLGAQTFRGLPFQIGPATDAGRCFLGFGSGGYTQPLKVDIKSSACWVIVAHRLLESRIHEGEPVGRVIATYRFHYATGSPVEVPVRERFEIAVIPTRWGQLPFLAVPDMQQHLAPRYEGRWAEAGGRLTEASQGWPRWFVLFPWKNPHPESEIASLEIVPNDRRFVLAALTVSGLDEEPFGREPRRPVKITLSEPERGRSADLAVEVDRGAATYPIHLVKRRGF
jgi:hypothetical protein